MNVLAGGAALYDPNPAGSVSCAAAIAMTAIDTTNLRLTVTVPAHGMIHVRLACTFSGSGGLPDLLLGVMDGSTVRARVPATYGGIRSGFVTQDFVRAVAEFVIPGLTPGSMTLDAAYGVEFTANGSIYFGGPDDTTGGNAYGAFEFVISDPQPLPLAAPGDQAGGLPILGSDVTFGTAILSSLEITNQTVLDGDLTVAGFTTFQESVTINASGNDPALALNGGGSGPGLYSRSAGTGNGATFEGGSGGHGLVADGGGSGAGLWCRGQGGGIVGLGDGGGAGIKASGSAGDPGIDVTGGSTNGTPGIAVTTAATSGDAVKLTGKGTGHGLDAISGAGATGDGIHAVAASTNGNGMAFAGNGTGNGMLATGGAGAGGDGAEFVAGGGVPVNGIASAPSASAVADAVWDEAIAGHAAAGSTGEALAVAAAAAASAATAVAALPSANDIADQVWDEAAADHRAAGSTGELAAIIFGLSNGMVVVDNTTHTADGLTASRIRVFTSLADVSAATDGGVGEGEIATITMASSYNGPGQINVFKAGRVP